MLKGGNPLVITSINLRRGGAQIKVTPTTECRGALDIAKRIEFIKNQNLFC